MKLIIKLLAILLTLYSCSDSKGIVESIIKSPISGQNIRLDQAIEKDSIILGLKAEELRILRNEIFARHGYIFKSKELTDYFKEFDWYTPTKNENEVLLLLTETDKRNIDLIKEIEKDIIKNISVSSFEIKETHDDNKYFYVKDSTKYANEFLKDIRSAINYFDTIRIIDNYLIFNNKDSMPLISSFPLNKVQNYESEISKIKYSLSINRINFTSISYKLYINEEIETKGIASISGTFYLAAEMAEDEDGFAYSIDSFSNYEDCGVLIGIGTDNTIGAKNNNRASFHFICKEKSETFGKIPKMRKK